MTSGFKLFFVVFLTVALLFPRVLATTRLHKGPRGTETEKILTGRTLTENILSGKRPSSHSAGASRLVEFAIHITKVVLIWNELARDKIKFMSCSFERNSRESEITLAGKQLDVTDFGKNVIFAIEQEDIEMNCRQPFEGAPGIDKSDNVLFYRIDEVTVVGPKKVKLELTLVPGRDIVPIVDVNVHKEPAGSAISLENFEIDDDDDERNNTVELVRPVSVPDFPINSTLATSSRLSLFKKEFDVIHGVTFEVDVGIDVSLENFKVSRIRNLEFKWDQTMEAYLKGTLTLFSAAYNKNRTGLLFRRHIPGLSFGVSIPLVGKVHAGAFLGINWIAELDASSNIKLEFDARYKREEEVRASLIPPRFKAVNKLPPGSGASSKVALTFGPTVEYKFDGFVGIRPVIGAGITYMKRKILFKRWRPRIETEKRSVNGNVGMNVGTEVRTTYQYPALEAYKGPGAKVGVCSYCHHVQASLHFTGKKLSVQTVSGGRVTDEEVFVENLFNLRIATVCLLKGICSRRRMLDFKPRALNGPEIIRKTLLAIK